MAQRESIRLFQVISATLKFISYSTRGRNTNPFSQQKSLMPRSDISSRILITHPGFALCFTHNGVFTLSPPAHPPYSPDLAPSDYYLFGPKKRFLGGKKFDSDDELKWVVRRWLFSQPTEIYESGNFRLIHCWDKCLNMQGSYVEKY
ncbi:hypothetical protein AVEN_34292-1 [Araneus ventricosus]|uniref:Mariner Mos1 transposase n=1 Tax=Araneus ventricosus TaxID=182803 RepID=A0A4Y2K2E7_ARAVE|nr:hypothetical protein AVEN_34292-1 [Araneus ventricosus]